MFLLRWVLSQAKKDGIDEDIAKYDGEDSNITRAHDGPGRVIGRLPVRFLEPTGHEPFKAASLNQCSEILLCVLHFRDASPAA